MARKLKDQQIDTIFKAANSSRQYMVNFLSKRQFVEMDQRRAKHIKRMDKLHKRIVKGNFQKNKIYNHIYHPIYSTHQPIALPELPPALVIDDVVSRQSSPITVESQPADEVSEIDTSPNEAPEEREEIVEMAEESPEESPEEEVEIDPIDAMPEETPEEEEEFEEWELKLKNGKIMHANWPQVYAVYVNNTDKMLFYDMKKEKFLNHRPEYFWKLMPPTTSVATQAQDIESPESPPLSRQGRDDGQSTEYEYQPTSPVYPDQDEE